MEPVRDACVATDDEGCGMSHIQSAIDALLMIWPRGLECEHKHAREAFRHLYAALEAERAST